MIDDIKNEPSVIVMVNDILTGTMGEKTMWDFLLSSITHSVGVDTRVVNLNNFAQNAKQYTQEKFPNNKIIIQNATYIDTIDPNKFTIAILQDNIRTIQKLSQQELNLKIDAINPNNFTIAILQNNLRKIQTELQQQEINLKNARVIVSNSQLTANSYPEYPIHIIPLGVDDALFTPQNKTELKIKHNIPLNKTIGIFVGSSSEIKGWSAIQQLTTKYKDMYFILVFKDNFTYNTENTFSYNRINQELLSELLNCATFFIIGSPVETQCLAAIEAALCNIPIIMHKTGIFADWDDYFLNTIGYFGHDLDAGIQQVVANIDNYTPRLSILSKNITIDNMIESWQKLINEINNKELEIKPIEYVLDCNSALDWQIIQCGTPGDWLGSKIENLTRTDAIILDIGANAGFLSLLFSSYYAPIGTVYAYEPDPQLFDQLKANINTNNTTNIICSPAAVQNDDTKNEINFNIRRSVDGDNKINKGLSSLINIPLYQIETLTTPCTTIDKEVKNHNIATVDLIKIDTEGSESNVILGAIDTIKKYQPIVLYEHSETIDQLACITNTSDSYNILDELGYIQYAIINNSNLKIINSSSEILGDVDVIGFHKSKMPYDLIYKYKK